ncbi:hypothetical protein INR75_02125 [Zunongwangia sp. SCSIO 43204]|uniref:DUF6520 family protein n=1 Tax=Zunongwangia sp. SCSIO 43204 TaxID=2779359 RepID=UPI001CA9164D|nr:DUF6520 family protein [Zunongwangia sp. SCSIO 43204]UAB84848.1 hypothetical protein INR75_02125 [Zunongwangia sp. SCSIO 43204]
MKSSKILMPVMAIAMALGLAFSTKANVQTAGWVNLNGVATQLESNPCDSGTNRCEVTFGDDDTPYIVYADQALQVEHTSTSEVPYNLPEMED